MLIFRSVCFIVCCLCVSLYALHAPAGASSVMVLMAAHTTERGVLLDSLIELFAYLNEHGMSCGGALSYYCTHLYALCVCVCVCVCVFVCLCVCV